MRTVPNKMMSIRIGRVGMVSVSRPKVRMTRQRRAILAVLENTKKHPTADEVFRRVRQEVSRMSLGTVYRNLDLLVRAGIIQRIDRAGAQMRFDANGRPHPHLRCVRCGCVDDAQIAQDEALIEALRRVTKYDVIGVSIEFMGICPDCQGQGGGQASGRGEGDCETVTE